jgi:ferredoxin--NADP+ reductase
MQAAGQDVPAAKDYILSALPKAVDPVSDTRFRFDFLASPTRILGDSSGRVRGLEVEDTTLIPISGGDTKAKGLGTYRVLDVDTVIFCIGDRVDDSFGLPVRWNEFVKNPDPSYPVDGLSYEAYDPDAQQAIEGVFVAGWSREASSGLVGVARRDGENGARATMQYLKSLPPAQPPENGNPLQKLDERLMRIGCQVITKEHVKRLEAAEVEHAHRQGLEFYKMATNEEMFQALGEE